MRLNVGFLFYVGGECEKNDQVRPKYNQQWLTKTTTRFTNKRTTHLIIQLDYFDTKLKSAHLA